MLMKGLKRLQASTALDIQVSSKLLCADPF